MTEGKEIIPSDQANQEDKKEEESELKIPEEIIEKAGGKEEALKLIAYVERFSGPLPHPKIFAQYQQIMPDAPDRIFRMAENQQAHRHGLEDRVIQGDIHRADLGLLFGFILFGILSIGGIALLWVGKDIQGYSVLAIGLVGGVGNFIQVGRERNKQIQPPAKKKKKKKKKEKE